MEKKNSMQANEIFSAPQRQHITGLLIILFKQYRAALSTLVPIFFIFFTSKDAPTYGYLIISGLLLVYTIFAILKYLNIKYQLHNGEFVCVSGVFNKKKITIPFDKIMNIDYEQNVVQQVLDVGKLKVETAGSSKEEIELYALSLDKIKEIRNIIFEYKSENKNAEIENNLSEVSISTVHTPPRELIYQLSAVNLLKSGLTANHFETAALILALIFSFGQRLRDWKILGDYDEYEENIYNFLSTVKVVMIVIVVFFVISVLTSMIRQVIVYFELRFYRTSDGFYISKGLLNKNLIAVKDEKIQSVSIKQNILRKWIGMFDFGLQKIGDSKQMINIPGMGNDHVNKTIAILYPKYFTKSFHYHSVSHYYFKRMLTFITAGTLIFLIIGILVKNYFSIPVILLLGVFFIRSYYLKAKKLKFAVDDEFVIILGGKFGTKQKIIPVNKIQTVSLSDSPYQRPRGLKTLHISDGGGTSTVPFVTEALGRQVYEYLIFRIEKLNIR